MKSLVNILESIDIFESFKSESLREMMSILNKEAFKSEGNQILPKGIAWDKIEENDVFYGETGDESFYKNFVSKNDYITFWYSLLKKDLQPNKVRSSFYLAPGTLLISCGNKYIQYNTNKRTWESNYVPKTQYEINKRKSKMRPQKPDESDIDYRRSTLTQTPGDESLPNVLGRQVIGRDYNNLHGRSISIKDLFEYSVCSIICIKKDDLIKYSTVELLNKRYDSHIDAVALFKEPVSDQEKAHADYSRWDRTYNKKFVDYPAIRKANLDRYEDVLKLSRYKSKGNEILKNCAPVAKRALKIIEDYSKYRQERISPEYIKEISDNEFLDIFFNYAPKDTRLAELIDYIQTNYTRLVNNIDKIIEYYKRGYTKSDYDIKIKANAIADNVRNLNSYCETAETYLYR